MREMTGGWSADREMAAVGLEIAYESYRVALAAIGTKRSKMPSPWRFPRPKPDEPSGSLPQPRRRAANAAEVAAVIRAGFGPSRR